MILVGQSICRSFLFSDSGKERSKNDPVFPESISVLLLMDCLVSKVFLTEQEPITNLSLAVGASFITLFVC